MGGKKRRSSLKLFFFSPLWNELRNLFLPLICFYQLVAKSDRPRLSNPSPMITCQWLSLDNRLLEKNKLKGLNAAEDGGGAGLSYSRRLCSCCWSRVKTPSCSQFHTSRSSHAWNTAVFSHKLWAPFGSSRQRDRRCSSSPKLFQLVLPWEGWAAGSARGTSPMGADPLLLWVCIAWQELSWSAPCLCKMPALLSAPGAAVGAPLAVPSSVPSPSCVPVLVTAMTAKTIVTAAACASATWLLAVSSVCLIFG